MDTINGISNDPGIRAIAQARAARMIHDAQRERGVGLSEAVRLTIERIGREVSDVEMRGLVQGQARAVGQMAAVVGTW